ncbi:MAG: MBL fold metallo-hydrolase [Chitinophagaceae bacterium]|nr:MBL fold metallo-hydrolase [Chitinophagaceae bacterium]
MNREKISRQMYIDWYSVAPGVWRIKDLFVNMYLIHNPSDKTWVLLDAGLSTSAHKIKKVANHLFWPDSTPSAIILTHAHFDHTGSLRKLADDWDVPVYAHSLEKPYLTGSSSYPPPDPSVGGGLMSLLSFMYPKKPTDIADRLVILPEDGSIPVLPEWRYYHTPGHAPGHISLFRQSDRLLLAGDAFVTTCQESALSVLTQKRKVHGPPKYFTYNWGSAERSVKTLAALEPEIVATGHGQPMAGEELREELHHLANNFREMAVPSSGRYVDEPALVNHEGVQYTPPAHNRNLLLATAGIATAAIVGFLVARNRSRLNLWRG